MLSNIRAGGRPVIVTGKRLAEAVGWAVLSGAIVYFFWRDVPHYARYTPDSYGTHWVTRGYLIPHIVGAGIAILVGLAQFSSTIRQRWPAVHRLMGRVYVTGCLVGAPAATFLATKSVCQTCKPALGSLAIYWFLTTLMAFYFARNRAFATHRAFMIRSYAAMNVFVIVRIGYDIAGTRVDDMAVRTMVEFGTVLGTLLLVEAYLAWGTELRLGNAIVRKRLAKASANILGG
jgi:uncharacterized membrane protein